MTICSRKDSLKSVNEAVLWKAEGVRGEVGGLGRINSREAAAKKLFSPPAPTHNWYPFCKAYHVTATSSFSTPASQLCRSNKCWPSQHPTRASGWGSVHTFVAPRLIFGGLHPTPYHTLIQRYPHHTLEGIFIFCYKNKF